ncbi:MAG: hypothetical protein ABI808_05240 [Pseudonocardiales bacterium]
MTKFSNTRARLLTSVLAAVLAATIVASCSSAKPTAGVNKQSSTPASTAGTTAPAGSETPTAATSTASTGDGCQFATTAQVSAAVGATVTAAPQPPAPPFNAPSCLYSSGTVPVRQITVSVVTSDQFATVPGQSAQTYFQAAKSNLADVKSLTEFGDEAFTAGSAGTNVYVRKGAAVIRVTAGIGGTSDAAVSATRAVTAAVLEHVGG